MTAIWILFLVFLKIGLFSIGGGYAIIPMIQEEVVEKFAWISEKTFTDIITISQMTPGPLAVNTSTFVGLQVGGILGAIAATVGCILCGVIISIALYKFFQTYQNSEYVLEVLNGLKSASLGLIISAAATIILLAFYGTSEVSNYLSFNYIALIIFALSFIIVRKWKVNPISIIILSGILGFVFYS